MFLKVFPANCNPLLPKSLKAIVPKNIGMLAVGGIHSDNLHDFPGVVGFGIGGALFKPSMSLQQISENAKKLCKACRTWKE